MSTARKRAANHQERLALIQDLPSEIPQAHYKAIFDALPPLFLVLTPDFRMVAANHARFRGTMSTPEKVIGKNIFEIFPDNPTAPNATGVTNLRASLERVLAHRTPDRMAIQRYDIPRPASEGGGFEERYWSPLNSPVLNEAGEVQYIVHQVEDITDLVRLKNKEAETTAFNEQMRREIDERRRVEEKLRASEEFANKERQKFEALFSESPAAMALLHGPNHVYEKANTGYYALVGERDIIGKELLEALPELKGTAIKRLFDRVFETGEHFSAKEMKVALRRNPQGILEDFYFDFDLQRVTNGSGLPYGVFIHAMDVSDKVAARQKIAVSEERFRSIFEQASIGIAQIGLDGSWLRMNQKLTDIVGYSREELMKLTFQEMTHAEDLGACLEAVRKLIAGEISTYSTEKRYIKKDGTPVWVYISASLPKNLPGTPRHFIVTIQDISIRKAALEALSKSEERFQLASRATQDAIWDWDIQTNTLVWNEAISTVFGHPKSLMKSDIRSWQENVFPEDRARVIHGIHHVLDTGGTYWQDEYRFTCADGSLKYVSDRGYISRNQAGKPMRMIGAMQDITRRKEMEFSLLRREQELRTLADSIPQLAWMADSKGYIFWYNRRWYEYTGTTLKEMEGWGWRKVHHPDHVDRVVELISQHWRSGVPWEDTFPLRSKAGEWRWFLSRATPIRDETGQILRWFGTNTDITEQLRTQEELKKQRTELESERDLREIFVATVSHDLRNPLSAAKMSTQLALRSRDNTEAREKFLARAIRSLERSDQMIQNLLDANRLKAGQKLSIEISLCDLKTIATDTLEELAMIHGNRFVLQSPDIVQGHWSCDGLRRVLENLCTNAVKYGSSDSPVTITLKPESERVLLSVHNFGPVIPKEQQTKLFEPFQRAVTAQGKRGWGLGLALVRGLVDAHGGSVAVTSTETEGTTFTVSLPF